MSDRSIHIDEHGRRYMIGFRMPQPVGHVGEWPREKYHPVNWRTYVDEGVVFTIPGWLIPLVIGFALGSLL